MLARAPARSSEARRVVGRYVRNGRKVLLEQSTDGIELSGEANGCDMVGAAKHRRALSPGVRCWVVFLIQRLVDTAVCITANDLDFPAGLRDCDLASGGRQARLRGPCSHAWAIGDGFSRR